MDEENRFPKWQWKRFETEDAVSKFMDTLSRPDLAKIVVEYGEFHSNKLGYVIWYTRDIRNG